MLGSGEVLTIGRCRAVRLTSPGDQRIALRTRSEIERVLDAISVLESSEMLTIGMCQLERPSSPGDQRIA